MFCWHRYTINSWWISDRWAGIETWHTFNTILCLESPVKQVCVCILNTFARHINFCGEGIYMLSRGTIQYISLGNYHLLGNFRKRSWKLQQPGKDRKWHIKRNIVNYGSWLGTMMKLKKKLHDGKSLQNFPWGMSYYFTAVSEIR